jgi:hypothetical protein
MVRLTLCDEHHILVGCGRSTDPMLKDIPGRGLYGKARRAFCSAISVMVVTEVQSSIPLSPDRCTDTLLDNLRLKTEGSSGQSRWETVARVRV